jgi:hypothetical protein
MCTTTWTALMCVHPNASGPTVDKQITHCENWEPGELTTHAHCGSHRVVKRMARRKCAKCIAEREQELPAVYAQVPRNGGAAKLREKMGGQVEEEVASWSHIDTCRCFYCVPSPRTTRVRHCSSYASCSDWSHS